MAYVPYLYTFDEYLDMRKEYDELQVMISKLNRMDADLPTYAFEQASRSQFSRLQLLSSAQTPAAAYSWQGADAEAYLQTAREIRSALNSALDDYIEAVHRAEAAAKARQDELIPMMKECESGTNMALDDFTRLQLMLAAQGVVDML